MMKSSDSPFDMLAEAPLTDEQRRVLHDLKKQLNAAKAKNNELQEKLHEFEQQENSPILNRPDFNREVARMLAFDKRYGGTSSILYFDFSNLDETAAQFGAEAAAEATKEIAYILTHSVRSSDIVGRLAPDEFGVLLMRCDNAPAWRKAELLASQLQQALNQVCNCALDLRVSYGAYTFRDDEDIAISLKETAHNMMSVVK